MDFLPSYEEGLGEVNFYIFPSPPTPLPTGEDV